MARQRNEFDDTKLLSVPAVMSVTVRDKTLTFVTPNKTAAWRAHTLNTKEPETIAWLDSLTPRDLLVDVGANVGMYTIYAAAVSGAHVMAFEPESQNYALLNENIFMNRLDGRARALPLAISDSDGIDSFNLSAWGGGGSCHSAGDATGFDGNPFEPRFVQGAYKTTLDRLAEHFSGYAAAHLKIDVDGLEPNVVSGASNLFEKRAFRSVLIEINHNLDAHINIVRKMLQWGYRFDPSSVIKNLRKTGPFAGVANYVFSAQ